MSTVLDTLLAMAADRDSVTVWQETYRKLQPALERLAAEAQFALQATTKKAGIKTHSVTSRVKSIESVAEKSRRKDFDDPMSQVEDLVGIRVVTLFLSDLPKLDELIRDSFEVHSSDDKIAGDDSASFGYMSMHYKASLSGQHSGPRYDDLKGIQFEIQTRTVVMDAWANVSHYLDYKGESSVPEDLRRDFFALSGLFYVADQHFEIFAERSRESQKQAELEVGSKVGQSLEINLDTMAAYLARRYPERISDPRATVSEMVEQLSEFGYDDFDTLERALKKGEEVFSAYESRFRSRSGVQPYFTSVGAVRMTLRLVDKNFAQSAGYRPETIEDLALWGKG